MSAPVKFYLEPSIVASQSNAEVIVEVADILESQKSRELCSPLNTKAKWRRRYYATQKNLINGVKSDRDVVGGFRVLKGRQDQSAACSLRTFSVVGNTLTAVFCISAYCMSPTYPSILIPSFYYLLSVLRSAEWGGARWRALASFLLGYLAALATGLSFVIAIFAPSLQADPKSMSVSSLLALIVAAIFNVLALSVLHSLVVPTRLLLQILQNTVVQIICCVGLFFAQRRIFGVWTESVLSLILSMCTALCWSCCRGPAKKAINMCELTARLATTILEHDSSIAEIQQLTLQEHCGRVLADVCVAFGEHTAALEAMCCLAELRKKILSLDYVCAATVRCF